MYDSWDNVVGETMNMVVTFTRHHLKAQATKFTENTIPTLAEVEEFLDTNYGLMVGIMARWGVAKEQSDPDVRRALQHFQVFKTVADIEATAPTIGSNARSNSRMDYFIKRADFEKYISSGSISSLPGVDLIEGQPELPEWTGTSYARKRLIASQKDLVQPDITRDMMESPRANNSTVLVAPDDL